MNEKSVTETNEQAAVAEVSNALYTTVDDYIRKFGERFSVGLEAIAEAGRIYADALLHHSTKAAEAFHVKYPTVSERTWNMLRAIGSGDLNPGAMILLPKVADRVKKLTRQQQDAIFRDSATGVRVINVHNYRVETVDLANMTNAQLSIALDETEGRLRTEEEQKAFIVNAMQNRSKNVRGRAQKKPPYIIVGRVVVIGKTEIGYEELKAIVAAMDQKGKSK